MTISSKISARTLPDMETHVELSDDAFISLVNQEATEISRYLLRAQESVSKASEVTSEIERDSMKDELTAIFPDWDNYGQIDFYGTDSTLRFTFNEPLFFMEDWSLDDRTLSFDLNDPEAVKLLEEIMLSAATQDRFDYGKKARGWTETNIDGIKCTYLNNEFGIHRTLGAPGYDSGPEIGPDGKGTGAILLTDENGENYTSRKTMGGGFIDVSHYQPSENSNAGYWLYNERTQQYEGLAQFRWDEDGKLQSRLKGDLPNGQIILIQDHDHVIRQLNSEGELAITKLTKEELLEQGISEANVQAHEAVKDEVQLQEHHAKYEARIAAVKDEEVAPPDSLAKVFGDILEANGMGDTIDTLRDTGVTDNSDERVPVGATNTRGPTPQPSGPDQPTRRGGR